MFGGRFSAADAVARASETIGLNSRASASTPASWLFIGLGFLSSASVTAALFRECRCGKNDQGPTQRFSDVTQSADRNLRRGDSNDESSIHRRAARSSA